MKDSEHKMKCYVQCITILYFLLLFSFLLTSPFPLLFLLLRLVFVFLLFQFVKTQLFPQLGHLLLMSFKGFGDYPLVSEYFNLARCISPATVIPRVLSISCKLQNGLWYQLLSHLLHWHFVHLSFPQYLRQPFRVFCPSYDQSNAYNDTTNTGEF